LALKYKPIFTETIPTRRVYIEQALGVVRFAHLTMAPPLLQSQTSVDSAAIRERVWSYK